MMAKAALSLLMETRPDLPGHKTAKEEQLPPPEPRRADETDEAKAPVSRDSQ